MRTCFRIAVGAWLVACGERSGDDDGGGDGNDTTGAAATGAGVEDGNAGTSTSGGPDSAADTRDSQGADESGDGGTTGGGGELPPWCDDLLPTGAPDEWRSTMVHYEGDLLVYASDDEGNRIPDFSFAGYENGAVPLPDVREAMAVGPVDGDDTANIQAAIDAVGALPRGEDGFRGALVLAAGDYEIEGTLRIPQGGVVLRGAGSGDDAATSTILHGIGNTPEQRTILVAGSGETDEWSDAVDATRRDVVTDFVPVGAFSFALDDASPFSVGDNVIVEQPSTQAWIDAHDGGATGDDAPWAPDEITIRYNRHIVAISGAEITIDAPVFDHLDRSLAQSTVYVADRAEIVTKIGIESVRIDIHTEGSEDEAHAWNAIELVGIEDAWVRDVTALHFGYAGVRTATASRVTVQDVRALDPVSLVAGGNRYNFAADRASNLVLVRDCVASFGRHHFVSNGTSTVSGIVFHACESVSAYTSSEGHRRWSQGLLFDTITESDSTERVLGLYNRGDFGTGHGWGSAHSVAWAYDVGQGSAVIQKPPLAQNYVVGGAGDFDGDPPHPGPDGHVETAAGTLVPRSLYAAQLCDRLRRGD